MQSKNSFDLRLGHMPTNLHVRDDNIVIEFDEEESVVADALLVATGREPNGEARNEEEMRRQIRDWMADPARIENRVSELERSMSAVVENL